MSRTSSDGRHLQRATRKSWSIRHGPGPSALPKICRLRRPEVRELRVPTYLEDHTFTIKIPRLPNAPSSECRQLGTSCLSLSVRGPTGLCLHSSFQVFFRWSRSSGYICSFRRWWTIEFSAGKKIRFGKINVSVSFRRRATRCLRYVSSSWVFYMFYRISCRFWKHNKQFRDISWDMW